MFAQSGLSEVVLWPSGREHPSLHAKSDPICHKVWWTLTALSQLDLFDFFFVFSLSSVWGWGVGEGVNMTFPWEKGASGTIQVYQLYPWQGYRAGSAGLCDPGPGVWGSQSPPGPACAPWCTSHWTSGPERYNWCVWWTLSHQSLRTLFGFRHSNFKQLRQKHIHTCLHKCIQWYTSSHVCIHVTHTSIYYMEVELCQFVYVHT